MTQGFSSPGFHPSIYIKDELQERGWTLQDLVFRMRRYEGTKDWALNMLAMEMYMAVKEPNIIIDQRMATELGTAFGVSPELWLNLDRLWHESLRG